MKYITRSLEPLLLRAVIEFPVVVLSGPRQAGKTTLLKHLFADRYEYVSLEAPDVQAAALNDPRGFLAYYQNPVIFDEIQYVPELLPYIKELVDSNRQQAGQFILTGSQNLLLTQSVNESLAGRAAILRLLPLSFREIADKPKMLLPWEGGSKQDLRQGQTYNALWQLFLRGGYPELTLNPQREALLWHSSYVQTYLERDIRMLQQVGDLRQFQTFLRALAIRSAQLLNLTELARDIGISVNTVKGWLSLLEATYQIIILQPYFTNIGKRLVKTPKVYFSDVGTLCYLVGLRDAEHALAGPMAGAIMETAVVSEVFRTLTHQGEIPELYFWRTAAGVEVDLVVVKGDKLIPIEIKCSATPNIHMAKNIADFAKDYQHQVSKGYVIYPGENKLPLSLYATAWPFAGV